MFFNYFVMHSIRDAQRDGQYPRVLRSFARVAARSGPNKTETRAISQRPMRREAYAAECDSRKNDRRDL
jgi:hypothetical protein